MTMTLLSPILATACQIMEEGGVLHSSVQMKLGWQWCKVGHDFACMQILQRILIWLNVTPCSNMFHGILNKLAPPNTAEGHVRMRV